MSVSSDDPFAYLEDAADPRTVAWTEAENARTRAALEALPARPLLEGRFDALLDVDALGVPVERGGRSFFSARRGRAEQAVLYVREAESERVLIDPATLDSQALVSLDWWYPSPAGTYVAYGLSRDGDERSTLHVVAAGDGGRLGEAIPDTRYARLAWFPDESGFYYTRYPPGGDYDQRIYRHDLGAAWSEDVRLFGDGRRSEEMLDLALSADGRRLVAVVREGWNRSDAYVADTTVAPLRFEPLAEGLPALYDVVPANDVLYVRTDEGAPRFRVFAVDPNDLARASWREIVAETSGTLGAIAPARGALALEYVENVSSVLRLLRPSGQIETVAEFAGRTIAGWSAHEESDALYVLHESFLEAPAVARVVIASAEGYAVSEIARVAHAVDPSEYRVEQHWFESKDGTPVPLFAIARTREAIARDGKAAAVLYGYGGFAVSLLPVFSPQLVPWLDAGGVYVVANLRGGGEFGEAWHRAGMLDRKQTVFDDFIAAAEYLARSGLADARRIAIVGGSNGGLLVAVAMTQRPELFCAVVCLVPLTDMLRFHLFLLGRLWIAEYGDPDDAHAAEYLRAYSPYHHVAGNVAYPPALIATAESDGRVDPMHARKFAARLQAVGAPVYVYVEPNAGHGAGKPRRKIVADLADRWSFLFAACGVAIEESPA